VKQLNFTTFIAPEKYYDLEPAEDPSYPLMTLCPDVEEIEFLQKKEDSSTVDWAYFAITVTSTDNWKLKKLPSNCDKRLHFNYYYNCAYHVRGALTALELTEGMTSRQ
jgi:hypothetical protein